MVDTEKSSVLIVGTYSGLNKGDRIMQLVSGHAVESLNLDPIISCPFPEVDKNFYPASWISKSRRRNLPVSYVLIMILCLLPKILRERFANFIPELSLFMNARLVLDTSGDMLTEDYGPHVALSHLVPLLICKLLDKELIVLAQSIGPFKRLGKLFDLVLSHAKVVTVRDDISYEYLASRGLKNIQKTADLGFLLAAKPPTDFKENDYAAREGRRLIGICPSALFFEKFRSEDAALLTAQFCDVLDRVAEKNKVDYLLIPHVSTPSGKMDDDIFAAELEKLLATKTTVVSAALDPAETKFLISKLFAMVTFRMHGAIAALDSFVPTLAVSYSHKTDGLFEKLNISQWVVQNDSHLFEQLEQKMEALFIEHEAFRSTLLANIPNVRAQAQLNIQAIEAYSK